MGNKKNVKRCTRRFSSGQLTRQRQLPAKSSSSVTSKIDARAAITTASSVRQSLPSKEKIEKNKKINDVPNQTRSDENLPMDGYTIIQNQILHSLMRRTKCQGCGNVWNGAMTAKKREGLFLMLCFECAACKKVITIETSPQIVSTDRRDVNVRAQLAGHLCGIRHAGLSKLLGVLNLPSPVQDETYSRWDKQLLEFVKSTSEKSMARAVQDAVATANTTDLIVIGDGFWQTRGFQSSHGAAALLSCTTAPQVLDIETCRKTCNVCMGALSIKKSDPAKYNDIIKSHRCEKNFDKSSGTMEAAAVLNMFKRSVSKYGVYYTKYVGDGDSKTHNILTKNAPYTDKPVQKVEDLNHFSKRMKRGLDTIRREYGRKKLSDGKTIGGKNRLSAQTVLQLQMTFASTIRKCKHDLDLLHKRSWAIFWHKYSTNDDPRHDFCSDEWCGYLKSVRDGIPYDHTSHALPRPVLNAIKPVFDSLCSRESLARVVNASTQNPNEAFHSLVWLMSPKHKASSGATFEIACHLAVIIFNDGYSALGEIFEVLCGYRGSYTSRAMEYFNKSRLRTEAKEFNRHEKAASPRTTSSNNDKKDDSLVDSVADNDDGYHDTFCSTDETSQIDHPSFDDDIRSSTDDQSTSSDEQSDSEDYTYYNPSDSRKWTEQ
ncbi:unnamed protein product [Rotaria magnacalcarata]